jgi:RND superfamily putative drug exporter
MLRVLPSVDFDRPLPDVDLADVVVIPDDISALVAPNADLRVVLKSAAKLTLLAPDAICVPDPLAFTGCGRNGRESAEVWHEQYTEELQDDEENTAPLMATADAKNGGQSAARKLVGGLTNRNGIAWAMPWTDRPVHPVTLWRSRLSVAIDALETDAESAVRPKYQRRSPVETTHVQLPTGDRLLVPTGAEALRLKGYLIIRRNSCRDYAELADMVHTIEPETAALVLAGMDRYYCCHPLGSSRQRQGVASQLARRLADPHPSDFDDAEWSEPDAKADWEEIRQRCLSVAVAMLEEAR